MSDNIYETRRLLDEYLLFHFGSADEVLPWTFGPKEALGFAVRTVKELSAVPAQGRALDLGCAVGRSSFELAALGFSEVTGIDYSHSFINAARHLQTGASLAYDRLDEGSQRTTLTARAMPRPGIHFEQGDAMNLRTDLAQFDLVHAANLLCRLTHPQKLIERLHDLVKTGGQLLLTTPCTWLADFTPPENWPTGSTSKWLKEKLSEHFALELELDMPFIIREHARKYQWSVAWGTRWRRRS
jgi:putative 4-mercaptohistidine N1-methyltranferase